jgi:hypothetical protein
MNKITNTIRITGIVAFAMFMLLVVAPSGAKAADYSGGYEYVGTSYYDAPSNDYVGTSYFDSGCSSCGGYDYVGTSYFDQPSYDYVGTSYFDQPSYDYVGTSYYTPSTGCGSNCGGGYTWHPPSCTSYCGGGCTTNCGGGCTTNCGGGCTSGCTPPPAPAPTCTITLSTSSLSYPGQPVTITWHSQNASSGSISGIGSVATNGSQTVYPNQTTTYTGTFVGSNGRTVTCTCTVVVTPIPVIPAPVCTLTVSQNNIQYPVNNGNYQNGNYQNGNYQNGYNQSAVISWTSNNATSGWLNQGLGNINLSGSRTVYPTQTTTYTATFVGQNGQQVTCSTTVNVNHYVPPVTPYVTLSAVPYTGLDLGPVGTVVYWGFLIAWCVLAAYLIAVKRVHMSIYRWYNEMLFGTSTETIVSTPVMATTAGPVSAPAPVRSHTEVMDPFILSQINRAK